MTRDLSSRLPVKLLAAGACFMNDTFLHCALQPSGCAESSIGQVVNTTTHYYFRSPVWLAEHRPDMATQCASQTSIQPLPELGRCAAEDSVCTSDASLCTPADTFQPLAKDCNLQQDDRSDRSTPYYGTCYLDLPEWVEAHTEDRPFCVWEASGCLSRPPVEYEHVMNEHGSGSTETHAWNLLQAGAVPRSPDLPSCNSCDQVQTGGCLLTYSPEMSTYNMDHATAQVSRSGSSMSSKQFFCAVSADVCLTASLEGNHTTYTYLPSHQVHEQLKTTCRLCSDDDDIDDGEQEVPTTRPSVSSIVTNPPADDSVTTVSPTARPVAQPVTTPPSPATTAAPQESARTFESSSSHENDPTVNVGAIVGIVLAIIATAAVLSVAVTCLGRRRQMMTNKDGIHEDDENNDETKHPATTMTIPEIA